MVKQITLTANSRSILGKQVKRSREKGLMPTVIYGPGVEPESLFVDAKAFAGAYKEAGTSTLVDLAIDNKKPVKILIHEPQFHYLHNQPIHADFYAVKMSEKIETAIPIHFVGTSPAVDELEGNLITNRDELNIRCFPADLIPSVDVDISVLATFDDQIKVGDIKMPETIEVLDDLEEVIASVEEPRSQDEIDAELEEDKTTEQAAIEELGKEETVADEETAATPETE